MVNDIIPNIKKRINMNNNKILFFSIFLILFAWVSCSDDKEIIQPSNISNLRAESREGAVILRWNVPADSNYYYINVSFDDSWTKKKVVKLASVYTDSILITGLLNRFGDYKFSLQPYSTTYTSGNVLTIDAHCDPVQPTYSVLSEKQIALAESNLYTNAQETSEGPIKNLLDDNADTFFHSTWNSPPPGPHYIQINLDQPITGGGFKFKYRNRKNSNNKPVEIDVLISEDGANFTKVKTLTQEDNDLPTASGSEYTSPAINLLEEDVEFNPKYLRFNVIKTNNGTVFFTMADFWLYECNIGIYDPEKDTLD
jgi:hypothetical protein